MVVSYYDNFEIACFNGFSFRRDKNTGYYLSSKKIEGKRRRLHIYVYEVYNGEIPKGYAIHHIDKDKKNNEPENLIAMPISQHSKLHGVFSEERKERARKNLIEKAVPQSKEWHKSEAGREWHIQHGKEVMKKRQETEYICSYCGKPFLSKRIYSENENRFCSNNCKSSFRRKSGIDNEKRNCIICGGEFIANKYSKVQRCKNCKNKKY